MRDRPRAVFLCHHDWHLVRFRWPVMRALVERGWEVIALCPPGTYCERFTQAGMRHEPYELERKSLNPLKEAFVVASLARKLGPLKPDLLHTFAMKPNIYGALATSWAGGGKRVATVPGLGSFYLDPEPKTFLRRGLDLLLAAAMRRVDKVILANRDDLNDLVRLGVCRPSQCVIIPECVDVESFVPVEREGQGPVVVTMAARLIRHKGVDEFLAAAETLKARWGERVVFQLAGEEDRGNPWAADSARIEACARRGIIRRLGFVSDVAGLLRGTDIFTLPSYYREGVPVSLLEAMSAGLAVVTTDGVGCRETVVPEESGLLVPVRDAAALAAALGRLIADPGLRRRFGRAARERARKIFGIEPVVAAHLKLYRELLPDFPL